MSAYYSACFCTTSIVPYRSLLPPPQLTASPKSMALIAFLSPPSGSTLVTAAKREAHVIDTLPTLLSAYETFDASELTDTVVVSNSFWSSLSSKLPALIFAEVLASVTFLVITSILISQGRFLLDVTSNNNTSKKTPRSELSIDLSKLLLCIAIDVLGSANEAIPVVGEVVDVIYAPIAALLLRQLFQGSNVVFLLEFVEEILPFTDVLPLATICWVVESFFGSSGFAQILRIGDYSPEKTMRFKKMPKDVQDAVIIQSQQKDMKQIDEPSN